MEVGSRVVELRRWRAFDAKLRTGVIDAVHHRIGGLTFFEIVWDDGETGYGERGVPSGWVEPQDAVSALAELADDDAG